MANPTQAGAPGAPAPQPDFPNLRAAPAQPPPDVWAPGAGSAHETVRTLWGLLMDRIFIACPHGATQQPFPLEGYAIPAFRVTTDKAHIVMEEIFHIVQTARMPDAAAVDAEPWLGAFNDTLWRTMNGRKWSWVLLHMW